MLKAFQALESLKENTRDDDNVLAMLHLTLIKICNSYIPRDTFLNMDVSYVLELIDCEVKIQEEIQKEMNKKTKGINTKGKGKSMGGR